MSEASKGKSYVSSRGVGFVDDEAQDKAWIAERTPFVCSLCAYPVMVTWKFCPQCGGLLEWKTLPDQGLPPKKF